MKTLALILIGLVAVIHAYIVVLEMLLWQKPPFAASSRSGLGGLATQLFPRGL